MPQQPSGLGWLPDGRMLVVSMLDRKVHAARARRHARRARRSLRARAGRVQRHGRRRARPRRTSATSASTCTRGEKPRRDVRDRGRARRRPRASPPTVSAFPNGSVITPDGATLLVGESMASRISAFDIAARRHARRTAAMWAKLDGATVDGMCLDAEGAIWARVPVHRPRAAHPRGRRGRRRGEGNASGRVRVHARRRRPAHAFRVHRADPCARRCTCCACAVGSKRSTVDVPGAGLALIPTRNRTPIPQETARSRR